MNADTFSPRTDDLQTAQLDLRPCTHLHTLRLICTSSSLLAFSAFSFPLPFTPSTPSPTLKLPPSRPPGPSLSWVILLLSTVSSPHLHTLELAMRAEALGALNCQGLELILGDRARFAGLESVVFVFAEGGAEGCVGASGDLAEAREVVRRRMPGLDARDLLRFETRTEWFE